MSRLCALAALALSACDWCKSGYQEEVDRGAVTEGEAAPYLDAEGNVADSACLRLCADIFNLELDHVETCEYTPGPGPADTAPRDTGRISGSIVCKATRYQYCL
jgi:hypothetical protein